MLVLAVRRHKSKHGNLYLEFAVQHIGCPPMTMMGHWHKHKCRNPVTASNLLSMSHRSRCLGIIKHPRTTIWSFNEKRTPSRLRRLLNNCKAWPWSRQKHSISGVDGVLLSIFIRNSEEPHDNCEHLSFEGMRELFWKDHTCGRCKRVHTMIMYFVQG